jgi:hypothetical protein
VDIPVLRKGKVMNKYVGTGILVFALLCIGLGCSSKAAGTTPEGTVQAFVNAFNAKDAGAIYDMLSSSGRASVEEGLKELKNATEEERAQACAFMQIDPADIDTMTGRDMFIANMTFVFNMVEAAEKMGGQTTAASFDITDTKIEGDKATVTGVNNDGREDSIELIKEGGVWKLFNSPMAN